MGDANSQEGLTAGPVSQGDRGPQAIKGSSPSALPSPAKGHQALHSPIPTPSPRSATPTPPISSLILSQLTCHHLPIPGKPVL